MRDHPLILKMGIKVLECKITSVNKCVEVEHLRESIDQGTLMYSQETVDGERTSRGFHLVKPCHSRLFVAYETIPLFSKNIGKYLSKSFFLTPSQYALPILKTPVFPIYCMYPFFHLHFLYPFIFLP